MRAGCCTVSFGGLQGFPTGHVGYSAWGWEIVWLPKGYAPTPDDKPICAFPNPTDGSWDEYGLGKGRRPPIIEAVCELVEQLMRNSTDPPGGRDFALFMGFAAELIHQIDDDVLRETLQAAHCRMMDAVLRGATAPVELPPPCPLAADDPATRVV